MVETVRTIIDKQLGQSIEQVSDEFDSEPPALRLAPFPGVACKGRICRKS
jgi:hypothetical protein